MGRQMGSRATPSLNDTSAPGGCCRAIPSLSSAGLCTAFPKALGGRGPALAAAGEAGAGPGPTCPGGRQRSPRCAAGSPRSRRSPRVSPPRVSAWEKAGGEAHQAAGQPGHTDSAPRDSWRARGQLLSGHTGTRAEPKCSVLSWSCHPPCQGAAPAPRWCQVGEGGRRADLGFKSAPIRA